MNCPGCGRTRGEVGCSVECAVCHRTKNPRGRSAALEAAIGYCSHDCPGYAQEPHVGCLWPGETRRAFGYGLPSDDAARCYAGHDDSDDDLECRDITVIDGCALKEEEVADGR